MPTLPATLHDEAQQAVNGLFKQTDRPRKVVVAVMNGSGTDREARLVDVGDQSLNSREGAKVVAPDVAGIARRADSCPAIRDACLASLLSSVIPTLGLAGAVR